VPVMIMEHTELIDMEKIREYFKGDQFVMGIGGVLLEVSPGYAKAKLDIEPRHLNGAGVVQGGAIFTLADFAFAAASNSHGRSALGINCSINYVKGISKGTLYAEATEDSLSPRIGSYTVRVTDQTGAVIAIFQGLAYRKNDPLQV
jgi:acyl-CoA thioesterase